MFGSEDSADILIDFLNAVLEYPPERAITALTIVNSCQSIEKALQDGLAQGREEGLEKGREEGLKQGLEQGGQSRALQIATSLLDVLDDATIAAKTDLTEAQVAQLRFNPNATTAG